MAASCMSSLLVTNSKVGMGCTIPIPLANSCNGLRRRFNVSCSSGAEKKPSSGLDRRNMLLGLGGMYGAANLISDPNNAYGAPIDAPNLKQCGMSRELGSADPLDVNACPPDSDTIIDFVFPEVTQYRVRPAAHNLTPEYIAKYEDAVRRMKALDITDPSDPRGFTQQANIHCAYCNGSYNQGTTGANISVHFNWIFFAFHRWYLYFYERILGKMIGDPNFALPFWNWDGYDGMVMPPMFDNPNSPLYDANRDPRHRGSTVVDLSGAAFENASDDEKRANNRNIMYRDMIGAINNVYDFYGQPYRAGDLPPPPTNAGKVDIGCHTGIHRWCGNPMNKYNEDLGNFYSAGRDPLFYAHHSNVDRLWAYRQQFPYGIPNKIVESDYVDTTFLFYNEEKELVRVNVGDAWSFTDLGYYYEGVPIPWETFTAATNLDLPKVASLPENVFPLTLSTDQTTRVSVERPKEKASDEVLVLENVVISDHSVAVQFDVYVNDDPQKTDNSLFAGTFSHLPHRPHDPLVSQDDDRMPERDNTDFTISLKNPLENLNIADDKDTIVVSIVPVSNADRIRIQGIKIIDRFPDITAASATIEIIPTPTPTVA